MLRLGFTETMTGTWAPIDRPGSDHPFRFSVDVSTGPLGEFRRDKVARMTGTVDAAELASGQPLTGTVIIRPIIRRIIRYEFEFAGDDGEPYRFAGQKDIRWLRPVRTWTKLPAEIFDGGGRVIGRAMTYFDLRRGALPFLLSFRPA